MSPSPEPPTPEPLVSWILLEQAVPVQLIPVNRHEVHLVLPCPLLDVARRVLPIRALVPVVLPRRPIDTVGTIEEDVDAVGGFAQYLGSDHPAAHVEETL